LWWISYNRRPKSVGEWWCIVLKVIWKWQHKIHTVGKY
jgi:hypothetical protein